MDQIRHKCGYCGWLFSFTTNFIDHDCFKHYIEDVDHISVDENYVVTILKKNPTFIDGKRNLDELLIEAVRSKPGLYDFRILTSERTTLRKNAMWVEVSNILQGSLSPEEAKARWKYLRDNYIKAHKKVKAYIPSGSAATAANTITEKSKFQYYEIMRFLNDSLQTRLTVSSLTNNSAKGVTSLDIGKEQDKDDAIAGHSTMLNSPQTLASLHVPSRASTPTNTSLRELDSMDVLLQSSTCTKDFAGKSIENRVPTRAIRSKRLFT